MGQEGLQRAAANQRCLPALARYAAARLARPALRLLTQLGLQQRCGQPPLLETQHVRLAA